MLVTIELINEAMLCCKYFVREDVAEKILDGDDSSKKLSKQPVHWVPLVMYLSLGCIGARVFPL